MLNLKLDKSAGAPPAYTQIVHYIETSIKTNKLRPGDKLPPERELAEQLGTARGTVKKAYEELGRKGLIEAAQGRGSFVWELDDLRLTPGSYYLSPLPRCRPPATARTGPWP